MNATEKLVLRALMERRGLEPESLMEIDDQIAADLAADTKAIVAVLPDNAGTDFIRLMETWTESQTNLTATLLDMAISATMLQYRPDLGPDGESITITSAELRTIAEQYHWERTEEAGSWTIKLVKISEMSSD